jgi:hypothetical protein
MEFKSFKRILKKAGDRQPMPFIRRVQSVWHVALVIAGIGFIVVAACSWFLYANIQSDSVFQSQSTTSAVNDLIKQTSLESVLKEFDMKAQNFKNLNLSKPNISDPSL